MQAETTVLSDAQIDEWLAEDIGPGDATGLALLPEGLQAEAVLAARQPMVACGMELAARIFARVDGRIMAHDKLADGQAVKAGDVLLRLRGPARELLTAERTALNCVQRLCGIATLTRRYVEAVAGTGVSILDTRKTLPGWRLLDKYATRVGGAMNHRMGLYDAVMIKDNHLALYASVKEAVARARASTRLPIIVECDQLEQVAEALESTPDRILLDNMPPALLRQAVAMVAGRVPLEASGGITLENIRAVAETGVGFISIGALTHSAVAVDIGMDVVVKDS
jgi:nicotinate-nucleotide pyrophosphorylase (carboxylating)